MVKICNCVMPSKMIVKRKYDILVETYFSLFSHHRKSSQMCSIYIFGEIGAAKGKAGVLDDWP